MPYYSFFKPQNAYSDSLYSLAGAYWSGVILNTGNTPFNITANLWDGDSFQSITLVNGALLKITAIPIKELGVSAGTYSIVLAGQFTAPASSPSIEILPLTIAEITGALPSGINTIGAVDVNITPDLVEIEYTTSGTASTVTQIYNDSTLRDEITILADPSNTAAVLIGTQSSPNFPLVAGAATTVKQSSLSLLYAQSSAVSQKLHIITGGYNSQVS
ncbi:MAG: hypothetical protein QXL94_04465 [Candidatus Parvarchaeum sp.]